jgi:hypothetical protein
LLVLPAGTEVQVSHARGLLPLTARRVAANIAKLPELLRGAE